MIEIIFNFFTDLLQLVLLPIDLLIQSLLPDVSIMIQSIYGLFDIAFSGIAYAIELLAVPTRSIQAIIIFYTFKLTIPIQVYVYKIIFDWYAKLK